jgi:hypothetical protein
MPDFLSKIKDKFSQTNSVDTAVDRPPFRSACFTGTGSLSDSFQHETGAHGWGNAELQNYIDAQDCSFMQASDDSRRLVLRARMDNAGGRFESARLRSRFSLRDGPGGAERGFLVARISAPVAGTSAAMICPTVLLTVCCSGHLACVLASPLRAVQLADGRRDRHPGDMERQA